MTPVVEFVAAHLVLLPVAVLLVLIVPTVLMVLVAAELEERTDSVAVEVASVVTVLGTMVAAFVSAGWLMRSVLSASDGWFGDHRGWVMAGGAALVFVAVALWFQRARDDEMAYWQLSEFIDEFTDEDIATMPKRHQYMVHAIRARSAAAISSD